MREEPGKMDRAEEIFDDALEQLMMGESLESVLALYPDHASTLRPMLLAAERLHTNPHPQLSSSGLAAIMARAQAQAAHDRDRMAAPALAITPLGSEAQIDETLVPGTPAPPNTTIAAAPLPLLDRIKLWLNSASPAYRTAVSITFALLLIFSTVAVIASLPPNNTIKPPPAAEAFSINGVIQSINTDKWVVNNINVYLSADTIIEGSPQTGASASITGKIENGKHIADKITVAAIPLATATRTSIPTSTLTPLWPSPTPNPMDDEWPATQAAITSLPTASTNTNIIPTTNTPQANTADNLPVASATTNATNPTSTLAPTSTKPNPTSTNTPRSVANTPSTTTPSPASPTRKPPTDTATSTTLPTETPSATNQPTNTAISAPSNTPTQPLAPTATLQPSDTPTQTQPTTEPTSTQTAPDPTNTDTPTPRPSPTNTPTEPPTATTEPTQTPVPTSIPTRTATPSPVETEVEPEPTHSAEPTRTVEPTHTPNGGPGPSPSNTPGGGGGPGPSPSNTPHSGGGLGPRPSNTPDTSQP